MLHQIQELDISQYPQFLSPLSPDSKETSILFSMLPTAVKSRLPRIPSFRNSIGGFGQLRKTASTGTTTPEEVYTTAMLYNRTLETETSCDAGEMEAYFAEGSTTSDEYFPRTPGRRQLLETSESKSGIGWKFAKQGRKLLFSAFEEASTVAQNPQSGDAPLARQLYIHSLTYLLRGLPSDLTNEETTSIRSSLPPVISITANSETITIRTDQSSRTNSQASSFLRKTLATTILQLFVIIQFILPYLKWLLASAYQYERSHKLSEKVVTRSITTVDTMGKTSLALTAALYGIGDGKVGQVLTSATTWLVEGVTGGIHDGLGEGLAALNTKGEE